MKLDLQCSGGISSRKLGASVVIYDRGGRFGQVRVGNKLMITPPPALKSFAHPWQTSVRWYKNDEGLKNLKGEAIEGFGATINPGLVGGLDPVAIGAWSDSEFLADVPAQGEYRKAPGLMDNPIIPMFPDAFRIVSRTNQPFVALPAGLKALGVDYDQGEISVAASTAITTVVQNAEKEQLYAGHCGIYLRVARPRVAEKGDITGGFLEGTTYKNSYDMKNLSKWGRRAQLMVGTSPPNPALPQGPGDIPIDLGFDYFPIADVFIVSPKVPRKGERGNMILDGGWIPFVRHRCFWNLEYRYNPKLLGDPLQLGGEVTGSFAGILGTLGGGFGLGAAATQAAIEGAANKMLADAASMAAISRMKGNFFS
jgi:hypothetical protein